MGLSYSLRVNNENNMTNNQPIAYGVLIRSKIDAQTYFKLDDVCQSSLDAAIAEARLMDREDLMGIFSVDGDGNFQTVYNAVALDKVLDQLDIDNMTDAEKKDQDAIDQHNARYGTTL